MRELPQWAARILATPAMDLVAEVFATEDSAEAEAEFFRIKLIHAFGELVHDDPDTIRDPLLRVMVRLADERSYDMNNDSGRWAALFSVLRDRTPDQFANWFNSHRQDFWRDPGVGAIAPWVYEDEQGRVVERFPGLNSALEDAAKMSSDILKRESRSKPPSSARNKGGGCYIATAVYGAYDAPPVLTLRSFRDRRLARSFGGRCLIRFYYTVSPALSRHVVPGTRLHKLTRHTLDSLVKRLESRAE